MIFSETWSQHLYHVEQVFQRIHKAGLTVKLAKCQLGMAQCIYYLFSHGAFRYVYLVVGSGEVRPDTTKVEAVKQFSVTITKKNVRIFLGLTGYYRRFIPDYSTIAAPLTDLTKKSAPSKIIWTSKCDNAIGKLKYGSLFVCVSVCLSVCSSVHVLLL